jgi:hypothetical protein
MQKRIATLLSTAASVLLLSHVHAAEVFKPDAQGYIRNWLMLAPIPLPEERSGADLILQDQIRSERTLQPKPGDTIKINEKEFTWKPIEAATNYFDFNAILKSVNDHKVGYMATYIQCDRELPGVIIAVGSNDEGRIYFNGVDIYAFNEPRPLELDADKGRVTLKKGLNVIIFKVLNEQNSWQGAMRFLDKSGAPLTDLKIKLSPEGTEK